jgi:hypothetical protein
MLKHISMKLRVIETGDILTISPEAKIQVEYCDSYGNPLEFRLDEVVILNEADNYPMVCNVKPCGFDDEDDK